MPPSLRRLAVLPALLVASALGAQSDVPPSSATRALDDLARARALRTIARADSLLRLGRVSSAEALYYAAARRRPRDAA
ncbi:MAG TPA: hypothetical protein VEA99_17070, partial [Gemmatimonadaceae bacterium]|nr:hypothetical protein [Gemmatimonadaceae bacterium]